MESHPGTVLEYTLTRAGGGKPPLWTGGEKLTEKQRRFCEELLLDGDAGQAALRAGYAPARAARTGEALLKKEEILACLGDLLAKRDTDGAIARPDEVMRYLTSVMRREERENVVVTLREEESVFEPDEKGTLRRRTRRTEAPQVVEVPAKLSDANRAAELLGRRYAMFTENVAAEVKLPRIVDDVGGKPPEEK